MSGMLPGEPGEPAQFRGRYNWNDIPSGPCFNCKENEGVVWYSKYPVDFFRAGSEQVWCAQCAIKDLEEKKQNIEEQIKKYNEIHSL